jgi:hypothetical protein
MQNELWKCEHWRAGQIYTRELFKTKEEAERFAREMSQRVPDEFFKVEAIMAQQVWN